MSGTQHVQNCGIIYGGRSAIEPDRHAGLAETLPIRAMLVGEEQWRVPQFHSTV
jgi:hypothetical protein